MNFSLSLRLKDGPEMELLSVRKEETPTGCRFHLEEDLFLKDGDTIVFEADNLDYETCLCPGNRTGCPLHGMLA